MAITPVFIVTWCWKQLLIFLCKSLFFSEFFDEYYVQVQEYKPTDISHLIFLFEQKYVKITETSNCIVGSLMISLGLNVLAHCKKTIVF